MGKRWTEEEEEFLRINYPKLSWNELESSLGRPKFGIKERARSLRVRRPRKIRYLADFTTIDTEEKAYILGFIGADGYLSDSNWTLEICLHKQDVDILNKIREIIAPWASIRPKKDKRFVDQRYLRLTVCSKELCSKLMTHGIIRAKTFDLQAPCLTPALVPHYIRGYFDGDGSVYFHKDQRVDVNITSGSYKILEFINTSFTGHNTSVGGPSGGKYRIDYGKGSAMRFLKYIYSDAEIFLDRKHEKVKYAFQYFDMGGKRKNR